MAATRPVAAGATCCGKADLRATSGDGGGHPDEKRTKWGHRTQGRGKADIQGQGD